MLQIGKKMYLALLSATVLFVWSGLPGMAQGDAGAVTAVFQDRIKGYDGTRDVSLSQQNPDRSNGKGDEILVGRI
ncbi:MAG TPA: hypothetical protein VNJ09_06805, partial [Chthonomonadales bacterium]|nr:hypothetical protein [Chthonomonadales bacterium]